MCGGFRYDQLNSFELDTTEFSKSGVNTSVTLILNEGGTRLGLGLQKLWIWEQSITMIKICRFVRSQPYPIRSRQRVWTKWTTQLVWDDEPGNKDIESKPQRICSDCTLLSFDHIGEGNLVAASQHVAILFANISLRFILQNAFEVSESLFLSCSKNIMGTCPFRWKEEGKGERVFHKLLIYGLNYMNLFS